MCLSILHDDSIESMIGDAGTSFMFSRELTAPGNMSACPVRTGERREKAAILAARRRAALKCDRPDYRSMRAVARDILLVDVRSVFSRLSPAAGGCIGRSPCAHRRPGADRPSAASCWSRRRVSFGAKLVAALFGATGRS
nr:hypothetical protein TQ38_20665 [Novosphingobium sp. P6W]